MTNQLQDKLLHYEVQPPEGVWNNIATSLNEQFSPAITERLYNFESIPSPGVWNKIDTELTTSSTRKAKVIPFYVKYRRPLKYSGAIAIFAFLAILTSLLISKKTESELPSHNVESQVKNDRPKSPSTLETLATVGHDSERVIAKANTTKSKELFHDKVSAALEEDLLPHHAQRNETVSSSLPSDKYMIYSDGDGNAIRLPKKIFSAFACPTDDFVCKERLQQLREKFAASAMTADFNGLLQILKSLQENQ